MSTPKGITIQELDPSLRVTIEEGGGLKSKVNEHTREIARLKAISDLRDRVDKASTLIYDLNDGENAGSAAKLDTTLTTTKAALTVGQTVLTGLVNSIVGFKRGQEVTIQDDVSIERTVITRLETTTETVTHDVSTPTTVVPSALDPSGNGGRKLVRLSNGWLVAVVKSGSSAFYLYKSTDNGQTWTELSSTSSITSLADVAIQAYGTKVFLIFSFANTVRYRTYDVITGATNYYGDIDTGQTSVGSVSLAVNSTGTELHAAWASKNSTYPNSFNIRYAKGTINGDGSVAWGSVEQRTTFNVSGTDYTNPCVVVNANGHPVIITQYNQGASINRIYANYFNGTSWLTGQNGGGNVLSDGNSYAQSNPCAVVDNNGVIHVVWHGMDSTDSAVNNIRYSKSTDGGVTWSGATKLTSGNTDTQVYPTITVNSQNDVFVLWHGREAGRTELNLKQRKYTASTSSWGSVITLTNGTTGTTGHPSSLADPSLGFTEPLVIYVDGPAGKVMFRGVWTAQESVTHVEVNPPLTKAFKKNALFGRTTLVQDTTSGKLKFGEYQDERSYDVSTPTNVVNASYTVFGNGGRKLVRLQNGWLVAVVVNQNVDGTSKWEFKVYVSKTNGTTWENKRSLFYDVDTSVRVSAVSRGNLVDILWQSNTGVYHQIYDAVANVFVLGSANTVDSGQTSFGYCSLAINPLGTELHAAWTSKNPTYSSSFNLRYAKGTINADGTVTWSVAEQVTKKNTSGYDLFDPCVVVTKDNKTLIFVKGWNFTPPSSDSQTQSSIVLISKDVTLPYNGSSTINAPWTALTVFTTNNASYTQGNPCAVVDNYGVIHLVWHGMDSTDTSYWNIRYSKSVDGGLTWETPVKLTTGNSYHQSTPSITVDKFNRLHVVFHGIDPTVSTNSLNIRKLTYENGVWGSIVTLTNNTSGAAQTASTLFDPSLDMVEPVFIYSDLQASAVKFRGKWAETVPVPLNVGDARYNVVSPDNMIEEIMLFVDHEAEFVKEYQVSISEI
jgi:hypothetical protein